MWWWWLIGSALLAGLLTMAWMMPHVVLGVRSRPDLPTRHHVPLLGQLVMCLYRWQTCMECVMESFAYFDTTFTMAVPFASRWICVQDPVCIQHALQHMQVYDV